MVVVVVVERSEEQNRRWASKKDVCLILIYFINIPIHFPRNLSWNWEKLIIKMRLIANFDSFV